LLSDDPVTGLRVKISIDEDGTSQPLLLPPGTIVGSMLGTDRQTYHLVRLDHPVLSTKNESGETWTLFDIIVAPKFKGSKLERLLEIPYGTFIPIGVANVLSPIAPDEPILDFKRVDYFATGRIERLPT
jgi:hypothetical protein